MGFVLAIVIFFLALLRCIAGKSWISTPLMTAYASAAMLILGKVLNLDFPGGLLQNHMELA
jgi:putative tricarboxylic transport membrane protein